MRLQVCEVGGLCDQPGQKCSPSSATHDLRQVTSLLRPQFQEQTDKVGQSEVAQSCLTLCDGMDCSLPGSSVHWIFQA